MSKEDDQTQDVERELKAVSVQTAKFGRVEGSFCSNGKIR
jgi:hypothetical protein